MKQTIVPSSQREKMAFFEYLGLLDYCKEKANRKYNHNECWKTLEKVPTEIAAETDDERANRFFEELDDEENDVVMTH